MLSVKAITPKKYTLTFTVIIFMVEFLLPTLACLTVPGCECPRSPYYVYCNRQADSSPGVGVTLTVIPYVGENIVYLSVLGYNIQRLNSSQLEYTSLRYLYLTDNNIEILEDGTFQHVANLERLWLPSNKILVLGPSIFSGITKLRMITLDHNVNLKLEDCSFSEFTRLTYLSLTNTSINFSLKLFNSSECEISYFPSIYYLDTTYSATEKIDGGLLDSFNIQTLYIGNENITVSSNALDGQTRMKRLHLCHVEDEFFNSTNISIFPSLTLLRISDSLSHFPKDFLRSESLESIYFSRTDFLHVPANAFELLPQLTTVSFVDTSVSSIDKTVFGDTPSFLRTLELVDNNISTIPIDSDIFGSPDLESLYIGNAGFYFDTSILNTFAKLEFASFYNFSETFFLESSLRNVTSLRSVYIYESPSFFPKEFLASDYIDDLTISRSLMSSLPANAFDLMPRISHLKITNCNLRTIHRDAFKNTPFLDSINLSDNLLSTLPENVFVNKTDASITLKGNPWNCDCNLKWFHTFSIQEAENLGFCYSPPSMHGTELSTANFSEFVCPTTGYDDEDTSAPSIRPTTAARLLSSISTNKIATTTLWYETSSDGIRVTPASRNTTLIFNDTKQLTRTTSKETKLPKLNYESMFKYLKYITIVSVISLLSLTVLVSGVILIVRCKRFRFNFNVEQKQMNELSCQSSYGSQVVEKYSEINTCDDLTLGSTQL